MTTNQASAYIALNNNRLRAYADVIYLKDGDEFQIELFNPYQVSVLAKIYINDNLISTSGLVIRPGQRYFLDRYIDKNQKFKFNTYTVDSGTTPEVLESIKKNGSVRVEFYRESVPTPLFPPLNQTLVKNPIMYNGAPYCGGGVIASGNSNNTIGLTHFSNSGTSVNSAYYSNSTYTSGQDFKSMATIDSLNSNEIETGRIEGGSKSKQSFGTTNQEFEFFACSVSEWKILPDSHKPVETKEIRNYCSACGTRMKKQSWKFCPNCGEKL
jgi:hypothetical protein